MNRTVEWLWYSVGRKRYNCEPLGVCSTSPSQHRLKKCGRNNSHNPSLSWWLTSGRFFLCLQIFRPSEFFEKPKKTSKHEFFILPMAGPWGAFHLLQNPRSSCSKILEAHVLLRGACSNGLWIHGTYMVYGQIILRFSVENYELRPLGYIRPGRWARLALSN